MGMNYLGMNPPSTEIPCNKFFRVTKVVADHGFDFSGVSARPKTYENGHENIFGLSVVL